MRRSQRLMSGALALLLLGALPACASGKSWVNRGLYSKKGSDDGLRIYDPNASPTQKTHTSSSRHVISEKPEQQPRYSENNEDSSQGPRPQLTLKGKKQLNTQAPPEGELLGVFRNTYYDFPAQMNYGGDTVPIMSRSCQPIAQVPRQFYEAVCVQGSGTLTSGATVSFSKRDCECAEICPRTGQKICFDKLDQSEFPWGRGALGKAITPLSTIAVDSSVIPLGTHVYIAEFDGVERHPGGGPHDGCFVAEDRGMKVVGKHVDIFTGNPSITEHLNQLVPSNLGVHVYSGTKRCQ